MAKNRDENPVVLSRIYTRTGDDGETGLGDGTRTSKTDPRLSAYADVEEANAAIGHAIALGHLQAPLVTLLTRVQNDLFDVGADLCAPVVLDPRYPPLRIDGSYVERLEAACDEYNATLKPLRSFILPGGSPGAALLHVARTVVRRAERSTWAAIEAHGTEPGPGPAGTGSAAATAATADEGGKAVKAGEAGEASPFPGVGEYREGWDLPAGGVNLMTARYLNRLSDLLFILCRVANAERGDILWKPGGDR